MKLMISDLLAKSCTVESSYEPLPPIAKIATFEGFLKQVHEIERNLSPALQIVGDPHRILATLPTGVRK